MPVTEADLQALVGKPISDICGNNFSSPDQNHCAHFAGHALGLTVGMLCGNMSYKTRGTGASIRCDELYNGLAQTGAWEDRPQQSDALLIFVTSAANVVNGIMHNAPKKHVGVCLNGKVYNFSNGQHRVVVDPSVEVFHEKFKHAYGGGDISLYFGVVP